MPKESHARPRPARGGEAYRRRLEEVNAIYDAHARSGLSNREIWRRFVYPRTGVCERTMYYHLKQSPRDCGGRRPTR